MRPTAFLVKMGKLHPCKNSFHSAFGASVAHKIENHAGIFRPLPLIHPHMNTTVAFRRISVYSRIPMTLRTHA